MLPFVSQAKFASGHHRE